jgi:RhtB (resistance to homoserine/threonine) family protein
VTTALLGFAAASTLLILAPGPDSMLVMRNTMRRGRRAGLITACGTMSGLAIWAVAAALGLSALVRVSHVGYDVLRFAGAAYLIWLGVASFGLFRGKRASLAAAGQPAPDRAGQARAYLNGLLSNLFNPKISVFFMAFLPAFIPAGVSTAQFSLVLGLWFIVETGLWLAVVAWLVGRGARWVQRPSVQRWLGRFTGVVLIGFGIRLATEAR